MYIYKKKKEKEKGEKKKAFIYELLSFIEFR